MKRYGRVSRPGCIRSVHGASLIPAPCTLEVPISEFL